MKWKIAKTIQNVSILCSDSSDLKGDIFLPTEEHSRSKAEKVLEVLNGGGLFFPFVNLGDEDIMLMNKDQILTLSPVEKIDIEPTVKKSTVTVEFKNGMKIKGIIEINQPEGRQRVQDFLNLSGRFFAVHNEHSFTAVNRDYVINVVDEGMI